MGRIHFHLGLAQSGLGMRVVGIVKAMSLGNHTVSSACRITIGDQLVSHLSLVFRQLGPRLIHPPITAFQPLSGQIPQISFAAATNVCLNTMLSGFFSKTRTAGDATYGRENYEFNTMSSAANPKEPGVETCKRKLPLSREQFIIISEMSLTRSKRPIL